MTSSPSSGSASSASSRSSCWRPAGCVAIGVDPDPGRVALAREAGFFATTEPGELEAEVGAR